MQLSQVILALACAGAAVAMPAAANETRVYKCATGTPQCCATDVLGVADLNCSNPPKTPKGKNSFISICAAVGLQAECCDIPILGQGLICNKPV